MENWERALIVASIVVGTLIVAKLVDRRLARINLSPGAETRYRVLRRTVLTSIVAFGVLSALLMIPAVHAFASAVLLSSAVLGIVIGFAAQRTLGNAVAGLLIAFTQPVRLGDDVEFVGVRGRVEEIGLTFTTLRMEDESRFVIPNEKLVSDTIRNATIVSREKVAEVTLNAPPNRELRPVLDALRAELADLRDPEVFVSALDGAPTLTIRARAADEDDAERLERELRLRAHERLLASGLA